MSPPGSACARRSSCRRQRPWSEAHALRPCAPAGGCGGGGRDDPTTTGPSTSRGTSRATAPCTRSRSTSPGTRCCSSIYRRLPVNELMQRVLQVQNDVGDVAREHEELVAAFEAADGDRIAAAIRAHVAAGKRIALDAVEQAGGTLLTPSTAERARRFEALESLLDELELDVLVLAGDDYRGHKGTLRWVADYNLVAPLRLRDRRPGPRARAPPAAEPGAWRRPAGWGVRRATRATCARVSPSALRELGPLERIGDRRARAGDEGRGLPRAPRARSPTPSSSTRRTRSSASRARKSRRGARGRARGDADRRARASSGCSRSSRPGVTEREIGAAMYERCYALGGEDPLFLSMYPERRATARSSGRFGLPGDRVLGRGDAAHLLVRAGRPRSATGWSSRAWSSSASRPS